MDLVIIFLLLIFYLYVMDKDIKILFPQTMNRMKFFIKIILTINK